MPGRTILPLLLGTLLTAVPASLIADVRIAYSADGNQHDADDWNASPLALAMIRAAGRDARLVHFDYNNHLGDNAPWRAQTHHRVVSEAVRRYGYDRSMFYNDQWNLRGAVRSIARAINASSAGDRLFLVCAGPMEVCWRGINAAWDRKERYVTVVSHSRWNNNHADTRQMRHRWSDIRRDFDVRTVKIQDQNQTAFNSRPWAWGWLRDLAHGGWLHHAVAEGRKAGDASDAGMVYYVLDGRRRSSQWPGMADVRHVLSGAATAHDGSGTYVPAGYGVLRARNSRKCLQVRNGSRSNGADVQQWPCDGRPSQRWRFVDAWGRHAVQSRRSYKCLDVEGARWGNGANVHQWRCHHGRNQQVRLEHRGDGWFRLRVEHSNKCLTIPNDAVWNGASLRQWRCHGGWNQQFRFE